MPNSEGKKSPIGQVRPKRMRKQKPEYTKMGTAGVELMKSSENAQEEKYKMLIQNIPCAVYSACPGNAGSTTFMSDKWKDWTGYSSEELYRDPRAWPKCIHPDDREKAVNAYSKACQDNVPYNLEYRIVHKETGQVRYVRDQGHLSKDTKGTIIGVDGVITDISKRKQAEKTIREGEEQFRTMLANLPNLAVQGYGPDGTIHYWNKANESIYGYTAEEALGKDLVELIIPPEMRDYVREAIAHGASTGEMPDAAELNLMCKDGSYVPVWSSHAVVRRAGREPELYCIDVDLRELKRAEEALCQSQERFHTVIETAKDSIFIKDNTLRYTHVNPAMERLFGIPAPKLIGCTDDDLFGTEVGEHIREIDSRVLGGQIVEEEHTKPVGGTPITFHVVKVPMHDATGKIVGLCGIARDITERKQSEEELRKHRDHLEELVRKRTGELTNAYEILKEENQERKRTEQALRRLEREQSAVLENLSDLIVYRDRNMVTLWASKSMANWHGITQDQIVGRICYKARYGRDEPCEDCHVIEAIKSGKRQELEKQLPDEKCWHVIVNPVLDDSGQVIGTIEVSQDITEQMQSEEALKASEGKLNAMLQSISDHMSMMDKDLNILWANDIAKRIFGDNIVGKKCYEAYHGRQSPCEPHPCLTLRAFQDGGVHEHDTEATDRDGNPLWFHCVANVALRNKEGEATTVLEISTDITERKRAEEELRIREQKLRALLNAPTESAILVDTEGTILDINRIAAQRLGKSAKSLIGMGIYEYLPTDIAEYRKAQGYEVIRSGKPVRFQDERGGRYYDTNIYPVFDNEGKVSSLAVFSGDITERKQAEESLRESEERFRNLMEYIPGISIQGYNTEGTVRYWNKASEHVYGYTAEEAIGNNLGDLIIPEDVKPLFLKALEIGNKATISGELLPAGEVVLRHKDGSPVIVYSSHTVVCIDGKETLMFCLDVDLSERKRAEETLRESEERLKILFESAPDAIYLIDSEGRFVDGNRAAMKLIGFAKDEVIGKSLAEMGLLSAGQFSKAKMNLKKVATGQLSGPNEYNLKRKDGSYVSVEVRTFPVRIGGKMLTLGIARDITEHKRTEKELLEHQAKLKSLASQLSLTEERERHRLATDLHDQISQSLVISKIKLDQLRKSSTSDEFDRPLEDICNCLGQIINNTRTLTFDLSYPILYELGFEAAVAEWLADQIQEKHRIETEFEDDGQQKPLDDDIRVLLFRNVRELLINVVKHAQANKVKVSIRRMNGYINVSVEDDGIGFDPVEVTSMATKRAEFGLFSIRERLEQLGGLIEIDSEPGLGSKITMTAPLKYNRSTDGGT